MRIAQLSTPFISVPPPDYGGTELVVYNITEGLVQNGHDVTLFAPGDSKTSAKLVSAFDKALHYDAMQELFSPLAFNLFWLHSLPTFYHAVLPFERAGDFDIIHDHIHYAGLMLASLVKTPCVHTYHGDFSTAVKSPIEKMIFEKYKKFPWTAISHTQKKNCPIDINFVDVIHHGIPIEKFEYEEGSDEYMVWLGRITPKKGTTDAIEVAKRLNKKLIICGVVNARDEDYFDKQVKPYIDNVRIFFLGPVTLEKKVQLLKKAKVLLYPVAWEEPFGLVGIEAMAVGTPVVGYARGAVSEVVADSTSGYLINASSSEKRGDYHTSGYGLSAMTKAVEHIYSMPPSDYIRLRRNARSHVEKHFTVRVMVEKYEKVYEKLLG